MLRQKYSYRKDIKTRQKRKSNKKIELKHGIYQKQVKVKFPTANANI